MKKVLTIVILLSPILVFGQYTETLGSDRPGQSMSPSTVGKSALQFQFGYTYSDKCATGDFTNLGGNDSFSSDELGNGLNLKTRFGIFERTEVSLDFTVALNRYNSVTGNLLEGEYRYESNESIYMYGIAVRQNLVNNQDAGFQLGSELQFYGLYSDGLDMGYNLNLIVAASKHLSEKFTITGNVGSSLTEVDFFLTCNLGYSVTEKLGVYVEYYPSFSNVNKLRAKSELRMKESYVNTGVAYIISPNFMLDLSGGFLVSENELSYQLGGDNVSVGAYSIQVGLTSRLDWRK